MLSGALSGMAAAVLMTAMSLMIGAPLGSSLIDALFVLGSYCVSVVFCIGTLPLWESLFDITTASRLMELSNANHPALKRLMTEAPGTYHHAMMVASIAEAGADAIGANGILARVGGYYHDLGKLRRPQMFMENIKGENPHDSMPPEASAQVILSHVRDGVAYAQKYKLPSAIQQIIYEHHGTTPVLYFYNKALQDASGKPVNLKNYRYPGAKPRTRESAIVMLADSVEAAVRSLPDNSRTSVEQMIRKVVKGKVDDEQLASCPLTFAHLSAIERAFIASYDGIMHERIEYPNMPLLEDRP
jgi:putative nucleotidyltransferase with HDIG domain